MSKTFLFQTFQFSISTQFKCQTVLFQTIQFSTSLQFNFIWPIDRTLLGATTTGSDGNEGVLRNPQSSSITRPSSSHCLFSYPGHLLEEVLPLFRTVVGEVNNFSRLGQIYALSCITNRKLQLTKKNRRNYQILLTIKVMRQLVDLYGLLKVRVGIQSSVNLNNRNWVFDSLFVIRDISETCWSLKRDLTERKGAASYFNKESAPHTDFFIRFHKFPKTSATERRQWKNIWSDLYFLFSLTRLTITLTNFWVIGNYATHVNKWKRNHEFKNKIVRLSLLMTISF